MRFPRAAAPKSGPNTATPIPPEAAPPEAQEPVGLWNQKLDLIVRNPALFTMKDYRILLTFEDQFPDPQLLKSAHLDLLIMVNNSGYPLFLPPLPLSTVFFGPPPPRPPFIFWGYVQYLANLEIWMTILV
jgi:hypothetical protein